VITPLQPPSKHAGVVLHARRTVLGAAILVREGVVITAPSGKA
jgi:hypothetical protein